ncbi:MAG TPA: hypothetical protein DC049_02805 [Spirochaetia bacterium]|nr:hypothetical protein [Spirochaetia bacterium]
MKRARNQKRWHAFTLIEILAAVFIITAISSVPAWLYFKPLGRLKTLADVRKTVQELNLFLRSNGQYNIRVQGKFAHLEAQSGQNKKRIKTIELPAAAGYFEIDRSSPDLLIPAGAFVIKYHAYICMFDYAANKK